MTGELKLRIDRCWNATELEDIYLPYKPKRRTRAQVAREQGLEPLSVIIIMQREQNPKEAARRFVNGEVKDVDTAIKGAQDIIAETVSEDEQARRRIRDIFHREAVITSKVIKTKADTDEAAKYSDYFDFSEQLRSCSSQRLLAMLKRIFVKGSGYCGKLIAESVEDGYKRLLKPSIENEFASLSKEKADNEAINVFAENLRQLLLSAPLGQKRVMGIDPGFRTGCKIVCLDAQGNLLHHEAIFQHPPVSKREQAMAQITSMLEKDEKSYVEVTALYEA